MTNLTQKTSLAKSLFGTQKEPAAQRVIGTATADSSAGMVSVQVGNDGDIISVPTVGRVESGDDVFLVVQDGIPTAIGSKGSGDAIPRNFVQPTEPTGDFIVGDTWTDTSSQKIYTWDGVAWVETGSVGTDYLYTVGGSVLFAKDGTSYGALVNANGSFDVVSLTWSDGVPTVGSTVATFGTEAIIGEVAVNKYNTVVSDTGITLRKNTTRLGLFSSTYGLLASGATVENTIYANSYFRCLTRDFCRVVAGGNVAIPYNSGGAFSPVTLGNDSGSVLEYEIGAAQYITDNTGPGSGKHYIKILKEGYFRLSLGARVSASSNFTAKVCLGIYNSSNVLQTRACQACDYVQVSPYFFNVSGDTRYLSQGDRVVFEAVSPTTNSGNIIGNATEAYTFFQVEYLENMVH